MSSSPIQITIFQHIKNSLPTHLSLAEEVASILEVSTDSAYRRIRGEKPLDIEEVNKLCQHFHLSLDQLLHLQSDVLMFSGNFVHPASFQFDQYLRSVTQHVKYMSSFREKKMTQLCKDISIFHHFHFREVAAFKHYVWMKGIFNNPDFANKKFSLADYPDELFQQGRNALSIYNTIDSAEIWNVESINSTMRQIDYYHDSHLFAREEEVILIYEALENLLNHLNHQADLGFKFNSWEQEPARGGSFEMYLNEMVIGDNSILASLDGAKVSFIVHSVINVMITRDQRFCENMNDAFQNLIKCSTLISSVSERERSRFFKYLRKRIAARKEKLGV